MHELPHREVGESMAIRLASGGLWLILNKYTDLMNEGTGLLAGERQLMQVHIGLFRW